MRPPLNPLCALDARRGCRGCLSPPVHHTGVAQRQSIGAHNSEVTRSKRVAGILFFAGNNWFPFLGRKISFPKIYRYK